MKLVELLVWDKYLSVSFNEQVSFFVPAVWVDEHPTDAPENSERRLNCPRPCRGQRVSSVWIFEEPVFARPAVDSLALEDVVANEIDAAMDELAEELLLQAEEEVLEIGKVGEVERGFDFVVGWRSECVCARGCTTAKRFNEISGDDEKLLKLFEAQTFEVKLRVAREEGAVVAGDFCK